MKKIFFFLFSISLSTTTFAQEKSSSLGISISRAYFKNHSNFYTQKKNFTKGFIVGLEYSETKNNLGFRAGIFYSKANSLFNPFLLFPIFDPIELSPIQIINHTIDFPLTGQLFIGKDNLKFYISLGMATTFNSPILGDTGTYYNQFNNNLENDLSVRGIIGAGFHYKIVQHIGVDIGINQRVSIFSFTDSMIKPMNNIGLHTKIDYIF